MNEIDFSSHSKGCNFFYKLSEYIASENVSLSTIYQGVVDLIPSAMQFPEISCAKLDINEYAFTTKNYHKSKWQHACDIIIDEEKVGTLQVGYLKEKPPEKQGPFLAEEISLLELVSLWIGQVTKRSQIKTVVSVTDIKYRHLVDNVNDGIYVIDREGKFTYANYALSTMLGMERPSDLFGRTFSEFLPPAQQKDMMNQYRRSLETQKDTELISTEVIRQNGEKGYIEVKPRTFITDGKVMGNHGVVRDITNRKLAEEKIKFDSTHDHQTGLYNRSFFEAEMDRLERGRQFPVSVVVVHMDALNQNQKSESAEEPDKKLKKVARTLFQSYRGDDIVARIEENQFAILLPNVDESGAGVTVERIHENLHDYKKKSNDPSLKFYIGASTAADTSRLETILDQAQAIVVLAKKKEPTD